jgi:hypothetical protein
MWTTHSNYRAVCSAALLSLLEFAAPLRAQMNPCPHVSEGAGYKILIDEVQYSNMGGAAQPAQPLELLRFTVETTLDKARLLAEGKKRSNLEFKYLPCPGRHPDGDNQFDPGLVRELDQAHVILEVWGTIYPLGNNKHKFVLEYALVPVSFLKTPPPQGIIPAVKDMPVKPSSDQILSFFDERGADLKAFYMVAAGAQAYADRDWNPAVHFLCKGASLLKGKAGREELLEYANELASSAAQELRKINEVSVGLMSADQVKNYCKFAMTR